ncbi:hypothetical protein F0344_03980 [Streptomyces finlayi]|uniref:Uncharacterized protein n=1 Tax=Streptomyces finlayi TaxID=67296 RepID=A0A7G7BEV6_9ACTN|nr:hypothetical protein [Streptomyces finlayi]QNE73871.1 hypothetical protein F0344_03980 [Streptomyces finlayi]
MSAGTDRVSGGHWSVGFRMGALSGIPTSLAGVLLVGAMWNSCDTGVNSSANSMVLIFLLPVFWVLTVVLWTLVRGAAGRFGRRAAVIGAVAANLWLLWFIASAVGAMDYPSPACPDNIPAWWPAFVPL